MSDYSLFELNEYIRRFVALNLPDAVWVRAELAEVDERRGHYYLTLVEKDEVKEELVARGQAVIWDNTARAWQRRNRLVLSDFLQVGRSVKLQVRADFHERFGLKFVVTDLDPHFTLGQLAQLRQQTLAYLEDAGLLQTNKALALPLAPQRLAIISSPAAAGLQDFLAQLNHNPYGYQFHSQLFPAAVQGSQTSPEVRRQLRTIERRKADFDAIVIIRGGGSRTDLADFDERELCVAAAGVGLPILTGIGHETDQSLLDLLVHTALKTPTAAADFLIDRLLQFEQRVALQAQHLDQLQQRALQQARSQLTQFEQQLVLLQRQLVRRQLWQLDAYEAQLPHLVNRRLRRAQEQLRQLEQLQESLSLDTAWRRGFSVVTRAGQIIRSEEALKSNDEIVIHFKDGQKRLKID
jgi:exodeoxyribonuclease VII large subunit